MHVLHLIKTSEGATWAIQMLKELKITYPEVTLSVVVPKGGKHFEEYIALCRNVYELDFKLNHKILVDGFSLRKIVKRDKPDIIHSWFTQTTLYARFFLRDFNIPRLFQVVGPLHLENRTFNFLDRKSAQKNDYWIATSKCILNLYKKHHIKEDKLFLNYAYIDIAGLLKNKKELSVSEFKIKHGIPENSKIIGTASYIYPPKFYENSGVKGHEILFDVFKEILTKRDDVVLVIAGTTFGNNYSYEEKLKKLANGINSDKIIFSGKFKNVFDVISNFDVFVYLSKSENLGGVFESLLFEIPTVSSNRGGLPELIINNETGYNCDISNPRFISEKIIKLIDNPEIAKVMSVKGKQKVLEVFDKKTIINQAFSIYEIVLNKKK